MKINYSIVFFLFGISAAVNAQSGWIELGAGANALNANNSIQSICTDTFGDLFAGGKFTSAGSNYVAKYNGSSWENYYGGAFNGQVSAICFSPAFGPFAAGDFTNSKGKHYVSHIVKTGPLNYEWQELDSLGANDIIRTLCIDNAGSLHAAGDFTGASGGPYVAGWGPLSNGWYTVGANQNFTHGSSINSVCEDSTGHIYCGGTYSDAQPKCYVASDTAGFWSAIPGLNANAGINTICSANGNIYAAGSFTNASDSVYVAIFEEGVWVELGNQHVAEYGYLKANGFISAICADAAGNVYAAGGFSNKSGKYYVAKYDGTSWGELGAGANALNANGYIYSLCVDGKGNVYAAGDFKDANGNRYVAEYTYITNNGIIPVANAVHVEVFPNPAEDVLNITYTGQQAGLHYTVFDGAGTLVHAGVLTGDNTRVDISSFAAGMYVLQVGDGEKQSFKLIKEK